MLGVVLLITIVTSLVVVVQATIDMNLPEFQYLANHLQEEECRKLVAALHFKSDAAPNDLKEAELKVSKDIPCLEQLLHWNKEANEGRAETHEFVAKRLRQIGREDLGNWLAKTSFSALGKDFDRLVQEPIQSYQPIILPTVNLSSTKATTIHYDNHTFRRIAKQDFVPTDPPNLPSDPTEWTIFDTISWTIVFVLLIIIIVLTIYLTINSPCSKRRKRRKKHYDSLYDDEESLYFNSPRRGACGLKGCPADTPVSPGMDKCPNVRSNLRKTDDVSVGTERSMPALDLMGVEMPQPQSPQSPTMTAPSHKAPGHGKRRHEATSHAAPSHGVPSQRAPSHGGQSRVTSHATLGQGAASQRAPSLMAPKHSESLQRRRSFQRDIFPQRSPPVYYTQPQQQAFCPQHCNQIAPRNLTQAQNYSNGLRTIDIHQKIAIPMNNNNND